VIGKSGQRIRQVRMDSGAEVELSDSSSGTSDRIITITGTLQQIQAAQYMMQMAYVSLCHSSCRTHAVGTCKHAVSMSWHPRSGTCCHLVSKH